MKKPLESRRKFLTLAVVGVIGLIFGFMACSPATTSSDEGEAEAPQQAVQAPEPDEFGVITADAWKDIYPDEYASYRENSTNAPGGTKHVYLEMYPQLSTLYAANAFSKGYNQPAAHLFSLDSVRETPRISEKSLQNCYTCKTPQFTALVNSNGVQEYAVPFAEAAAFIEPISCYNCHANDPDSLTLVNQFWVTALGNDRSAVPESAASCGQCHNEYYFDPETKATTNPYTGLAAMNPEKILAYYDSIDFSDWVYPTTETGMIKIQHPEFETVYGGGTPSVMAEINGYGCADCHMGESTNADGQTYTSHYWGSPLENRDLLDSTCQMGGCHTDLAAQVTGWQDDYHTRLVQVTNDLEQMVIRFVAAVEAGTLSDDDLTTMQTIHRSAQFYWDFAFVENSNGAHNRAFTNSLFDKVEALIAEGNALLG